MVVINPCFYYLLISHYESFVLEGYWEIKEFISVEEALKYKFDQDLTKDHIILSGKEMINKIFK